jgi:hypothetical protein
MFPHPVDAAASWPSCGCLACPLPAPRRAPVRALRALAARGFHLAGAPPLKPCRGFLGASGSLLHAITHASALPISPLSIGLCKLLTQLRSRLAARRRTCGPASYIEQKQLLEMMLRHGATHHIIDSLMKISGLEEDYVAQGEFLKSGRRNAAFLQAWRQGSDNGRRFQLSAPHVFAAHQSPAQKPPVPGVSLLQRGGVAFSRFALRRHQKQIELAGVQLLARTAKDTPDEQVHLLAK